VHGLERLDGVVAVRARRLEAELRADPVEELVGHALPHAHRAVALHVAVAAHGAHAGAGPADAAAQQEDG
jgi:hypothetical protein